MCCLCCLFLIYCMLDFRSSICIFLANSVWRLCLSTCLELYVHKIKANSNGKAQRRKLRTHHHCLTPNVLPFLLQKCQNTKWHHLKNTISEVLIDSFVFFTPGLKAMVDFLKIFFIAEYTITKRMFFSNSCKFFNCAMMNATRKITNSF